MSLSPPYIKLLKLRNILTSWLKHLLQAIIKAGDMQDDEAIRIAKSLYDKALELSMYVKMTYELSESVNAIYYQNF